jgi:hypothetical protein
VGGGLPGGGGAGGAGGAPQTPWIDPCGATQGNPVQQSALTVHELPEGLHATWQASLPSAPGTQWPPLQQSPS